MTSQIADEVRYRGRWSAITAVDGSGLFDPTAHAIHPGPLSSGCWRGFRASYVVRHGRLILHAVEVGRPDTGGARRLFGVKPHSVGAGSLHPQALLYRRLDAPVLFSGRLLIGAGETHVEYLNMGFRPAWLYRRVHELVFRGGRLTAVHNRSTELATVRNRLGRRGLDRPAGMATEEWVARTFSLTFDYSWPAGPSARPTARRTAATTRPLLSLLESDATVAHPAQRDDATAPE